VNVYDVGKGLIGRVGRVRTDSFELFRRHFSRGLTTDDARVLAEGNYTGLLIAGCARTPPPLHLPGRKERALAAEPKKRREFDAEHEPPRRRVESQEAMPASPNAVNSSWACECYAVVKAAARASVTFRITARATDVPRSSPTLGDTTGIDGWTILLRLVLSQPALVANKGDRVVHTEQHVRAHPDCPS
jgi:hypothetical protein